MYYKDNLNKNSVLFKWRYNHKLANYNHILLYVCMLNFDSNLFISTDIRLRVRAEYSDHVTALTGNVNSNKPTQLERQFEKFMQATNILKSRDLGSIVCDIKFTELTYLDAFWRDYLNGSLLEALKGVFITGRCRLLNANWPLSIELQFFHYSFPWVSINILYSQSF